MVGVGVDVVGRVMPTGDATRAEPVIVPGLAEVGVGDRAFICVADGVADRDVETPSEVSGSVKEYWEAALSGGV